MTNKRQNENENDNANVNVNAQSEGIETTNMQHGKKPISVAEGFALNHYNDVKIVEQLITPDAIRISPPCDKMLIRGEQPNHKLITIMGDKISPDDSIGVLMRSKSVRNELMRAYDSLGLLNEVLKSIFGSTNTVRAKTPYYNSDSVLSAVNTHLKEYALESRLVYASTLSELLDVFGMREGALQISFIIDETLPAVPTKNVFLREAVDVDLVDKFLHTIGKFHAHVTAKELPKGNFRMAAYADALFVAHQGLSRHLQDVEISESFINDSLIVLLRHLTQSESEIQKFGHYNHPILADMAKNATLVRFAFGMKDEVDAVTRLPAHSLENECSRTMRLANSLVNYKVTHNVNDVYDLILTNRPGKCGLLSATLLSKLTLKPYVEGLRVVVDTHHTHKYHELSPLHTAFASMIPMVPNQVYDMIRQRSAHAAEVISQQDESNITVLVEDDSFACLSDVASMLSSHSIILNDLNVPVERSWLVVDKHERLRLPKSLLKGMSTTDPLLVIMAFMDDGHVGALKQIDQSLLRNGKRFFGIVKKDLTLKQLSTEITINNPYDDGTVLVPIVSKESSLPVFSQLHIEEAYSIINVLNNMATAISKLDTTDRSPLKAHFTDTLVTLVVAWAQHSVPFVSFVHRAMSESALKGVKNKGNARALHVREAILRANTYDIGVISMSAALGLLSFLEGVSLDLQSIEYLDKYAYEVVGRQLYNIINK